MTLLLFVYAAYSRARMGITPRKEPDCLLRLRQGSSIKDILRKLSAINGPFEIDGGAALDVCKRSAIYFFPAGNPLRMDCSNGWTVCEQRKAAGIPPLTGGMLYLIRLLGLLNECHVMLIRAYDPYISRFMAQVVSAFRGRPYCFAIHSDYDKRYEMDGVLGTPLILGLRKLAKRLEAASSIKRDCCKKLLNLA